jgi:hypothetical protein
LILNVITWTQPATPAALRTPDLRSDARPRQRHDGGDAEDANNGGIISAAGWWGPVNVNVTLPAGSIVGDTLTVTDGDGQHHRAGCECLSRQAALPPAPWAEQYHQCDGQVTNAAGNVGANSARQF